MDSESPVNNLINLIKPYQKSHPIFFQLGIGALLIFVTLLVGKAIVSSRPEAKKVEARAPFELVEVVEAARSNLQTHVVGYGNVEPEKEVMINLEVSGKILLLSDKLVKGGLVERGDTLLKIDPRNFQTQVELEKANVAKAEAELKLEQGRQIIAEKEWAEFGSKDADQYEVSRELVLRKPQIKEKEAQLEGAKSRLFKAELDLERTELTAPFNAIITDENVELGQFISPTTQIARLVASDTFRIVANLPYDRLSMISFPSETSKGSLATVSYESLGGPLLQREGFVFRMLPDLTPGGRTARVLVAINDPLGLKENHQVPLLLGSYVKVEIQGPLLEDVIVLSRNLLRDRDTVWVKNASDHLEIRSVEVIYKNSTTVALSKGIEEGEQIVTSNLPIPVEGMRLQVVGEEGDNGN